MDISNRDILQLIAKFIDNKETFYSFALLCKKTASISKQLKTIKILELNPLRFEATESGFSDRVDCVWHGAYTKGYVNCRGTRVWFLPTGFKIIYSRDLLPHQLRAFMTKLRNPREDFPGDCCNLRSDHLAGIISSLEGKDTKACRFTTITDSHLKARPKDYQRVFEIVDTRTVLLLDDNYAQTIWTPVDISGVITELKRVLLLCDEEDVTFDWV